MKRSEAQEIVAQIISTNEPTEISSWEWADLILEALEEAGMEPPSCDRTHEWEPENE